MNTRQIVAKNTILQMLLHFINLLVGIYSISLIARYLGKVAFGKYGFVSSFYAFFLTFLDFGISMITLREVAKERERADLLLGNLITFKLFLSILLIFFALGIVSIFPFPADLKFALLVYAPILLFIGLESIQVIFEADLRFEYIALASFCWRILSLLFVMLAVFLNLGLMAIVLSFVLAEMAKCIILYIFSRRFIKLKIFHFQKDLLSKVLKKGLPIGIATILFSIIRNIDTMMLTKMKGFAEVGAYLASYRIYDISITLPVALIASLFPLKSKFYVQDFNTFKGIYQKAFDILSVCGILITVLVLAFSNQIIVLFFGANFIASATSLRILIFSALLFYLGIGPASLLTVADRQLVNVWIYLLAAPVNIALNLILISRFSFIGAAISNVITVFLVVSLTMYFVRVRLKIPLKFTKMNRSVVTGLITLVFLFCLKDFKLFISLPIGLLLYTSLAIYIKAIDKEDIILLVKQKIP